MKKFKKRHFQLMEVMIAMFLVVVCAVPALEIYTNMYKQQVEAARNYEADHVVHLLHAKIIENMYKNFITFDDILNGGNHQFEDHEIGKQLRALGYNCNFTLRKTNHKKIKGEQWVRYLVELNIHLKDKAKPEIEKTYAYVHFVQGPPVQGEELEEVTESNEEGTEPNENIANTVQAVDKVKDANQKLVPPVNQ